MNKTAKITIGQYGQASLLITYVVLFLLLFVGLFLTNLALKQVKITRNIYNSVQAYYLADAGTEAILYRTNLDESDPDKINLSDFSVGDTLLELNNVFDSYGSFKVEKTSDSPSEIRISGVYKEVARAIELSW